jgi:hypothetical protein
MSPLKPLATKLAPLTIARVMGLTGLAAPLGVVLVTKPTSLVGDACPWLVHRPDCYVPDR